MTKCSKTKNTGHQLDRVLKLVGSTVSALSTNETPANIICTQGTLKDVLNTWVRLRKLNRYFGTTSIAIQVACISVAEKGAFSRENVNFIYRGGK